tara:strand:- start:2611 stop:4158 length:1548 start_codon:yes stop_codon:yes gene_type:complete
MTVNPNRIQRDYYEGNNYGDYQFTSLQDIVNQFLVVYVGEEKVINKASKTDVAFHAQRALQELSFDTFKSVKSQEIVLPPSLQMALPHDYINYTNVSWSDSSGVQHILYPASKTSNPFKIKQDENGNYDFSSATSTFGKFKNRDFSSSLSSVNDWAATVARVMTANNTTNNPNGVDTFDIFNSVSGKLTAKIHKETFEDSNGITFTYGRHYSCWQAVDVTGIDEINLSGLGVAPANATGAEGAVIRLGVSRTQGDPRTNPHKENTPSLNGQTYGSAGKGPNFIPYDGNPAGKAYMQWTGSNVEDNRTQNLQSINVADYNEVFILITMFVPGDLSNMVNNSTVLLTLDDVGLTFDGVYSTLQQDGDSTTWTNYKSTNSSENNNHEYDTDNYDLIVGKRYGLDPQHSQVNGSFYIDNLKGLINFSSNISGKTVILKYISDSLGTDAEMQVHKFAQEAMYKHIMYAILSTKANVPEYIVRRYKQEKFAATRQAKLRLSNIKLEEITQTLRGKSKWIKH